MLASPESFARGQRDPDELRLDILAEAEALGPAEVPAAGQLAGNRDLELMFARGNVAGVDPLHASLLQGLQLLEAVDVMRDESSPSIWIRTESSRRASPSARETKTEKMRSATSAHCPLRL